MKGIISESTLLFCRKGNGKLRRFIIYLKCGFASKTIPSTKWTVGHANVEDVYRERNKAQQGNFLGPLI